MNGALPDATITGYEGIIETLDLPDSNDRHVLAAAIHAKVELIVTENIRDFPSRVLAQYGLGVIRPDDFLSSLFENEPAETVVVLHTQRSLLNKPSKSPEEFVEIFERMGLSQFASLIRKNIEHL